MIHSPGPSSPAHRQVAIVAVLLLFAAAYFYQDPEWNGNSRLDLTKAIVENNSLRIDAYESQADWSTGDKALFAGHYYSDKAIGSSVLAVPFYFILYKISSALGIALGSALVKHLLTTLVIGGSFTVCGVVMYLIAFRVTQQPRRSLVATLAVALGTMLWPYSAVYYGHVLAGAFLALAFYLLLSMRQSPDSVSFLRLFGAGLAVGLAFITDYTSALIIVGLAVYALFRLRRLSPSTLVRCLAAASAGAIIPVSLSVAYNVAVYGTALTTGYAFEAQQGFQEGMSSGLMGLHLPRPSIAYHITFDSQFGVFWQSPVLLLAAAGLYATLRSPEYRAEAILCTYAIGVMIAMNAGYYLWWGGSAFGPRLIIPALPFFILPLAFTPRRLGWALVVLGLISAAQMLIPLMGQVQPTKLTFKARQSIFYVADKPFTGFSLLYDYGLPEITRRHAAGAESWNLGTGLGLPYWMSVPALTLVELALLVLFYRRSRYNQVVPEMGSVSADGSDSDHHRLGEIRH
jgi:hypothetical protein